MPAPLCTHQTQRLAQLREWSRHNNFAWWVDKTDTQLLNETRLSNRKGSKRGRFPFRDSGPPHRNPLESAAGEKRRTPHI